MQTTTILISCKLLSSQANLLLSQAKMLLSQAKVLFFFAALELFAILSVFTSYFNDVGSEINQQAVIDAGGGEVIH